MVWGVFRPVILLPADANHWQSERHRAVLLHELAHIQRRDWLMQTIAQLTCAVYWFNPLVWVAMRRMLAEAEQACDDHVLNAGYQSTDYAQHLLDIVRNVKAAGATSRAAVAMARPSKMEGRLRTVLAANRNRHPVTKVAVGDRIARPHLFRCSDGRDGVWQKRLTKRTPYIKKFRRFPISCRSGYPKTQQKWRKRHGANNTSRNGNAWFNSATSFLKAYPKSKHYDEVWYEKLSHLRYLKRDAEFDAGVDAFLAERPSSKYADKLHRRRAYHLESQFKFQEALAELDKIDDPALLPEVYERKGQIYSRMNNWAKREEFDLLRAELILGKSAPEIFAYERGWGSCFIGCLAR